MVRATPTDVSGLQVAVGRLNLSHMPESENFVKQIEGPPHKSLPKKHVLPFQHQVLYDVGSGL